MWQLTKGQRVESTLHDTKTSIQVTRRLKVDDKSEEEDEMTVSEQDAMRKVIGIFLEPKKFTP